MRGLRASLLVLAVTGLLGGCNSFESQPKSAVINTKDVITKCNEGIRVVAEVQKQFADRQAQLKAEDEAIGKLRHDPARQGDLQARVQKLVDDSQQLRKDVSEVEATKFKPIVDKINKVLAAYAKEHQLLSIQDKNGFAYIDPSLDITEAIIKKLDEAK